MSPRRNPFEASAPAPAPTSSPTIYDSLRVAAPRTRNRQWEKEHQNDKVTYRGVDPKLALQVKAIANNLNVPDGEVARALLEYALRAYAEGDLVLDPRPNPYRLRMTLFPMRETSHHHEATAKTKSRKPPEALWRVITTWRGFPAKLKNEIADSASKDQLDVPLGELVTALLRHGLRAYDAGLLKLEPVERATRMTLAHGGNV